MTLGIVAETYLSWLPAWSSTGLAVMAAICVMLWLGLRILWGASHLHGRFGLLLLRCCTLGLIAVILFGPTIVDEHSSEITRPSLLYVLDGSQSMQLGQAGTRWDESLQFVQDAERAAGPRNSRFSQAFRFGHQLQPLWLEPEETSSAGSFSGSLLPSATASESRHDAIPGPDASDSRLADALRQLLPQVNSTSTSGVVLLSDGRVRDTDSVEQLAMMFGKSKVPIHVVPVGEAGGTGDVAVVSLVVPRSVRKYTENELQVFLRSFGFTGERTTVRVRKRDQVSQPQSSTLAEIPVTLSGGAQSVSLKFRMDETPEDLVIEVDPIEGELTARNNSIETRVDINRTKVRVLYVAGESGQSSLLSSFSSSIGLARSSNNDLTVSDALEADKDIECRALVSIAGAAPRIVSTDNAPSNSRGFPASRAELFAYDCVIFSDVGPNVLEEQQVQWLTQWVGGRGGGLIVTGSAALDQEAWQDSPLSPLLPLDFESASPPQQPTAVDVKVTERHHPIWRLRLEERLNDDLLEQLPPLQMADLSFVPKPTAEVLATRRESGDAVLLAHRAGRGRVIATPAELGGRSLNRLGESWGSQPERVASKLWRNLVYWATEGSSTGRRRLIAQCDKQFYRPGETLKVTATAYDETARQTKNYEIWAMFEPTSLDEMSLYSPILWPDDIPRESGETGPRIVWGEELPLTASDSSSDYELDLALSETENSADSGFRIELTAYLESGSDTMFSHGTQVDSTSLSVRILNDPFEQQNPLPNHELLRRLADVSGGSVLETPAQLAEILRDRKEIRGAPRRELSPAWSRWWVWLSLLGLLSCEWVWRRVTGLA